MRKENADKQTANRHNSPVSISYVFQTVQNVILMPKPRRQIKRSQGDSSTLSSFIHALATIHQNQHKVAITMHTEQKQDFSMGSSILFSSMWPLDNLEACLSESPICGVGQNNSRQFSYGPLLMGKAQLWAQHLPTTNMRDQLDLKWAIPQGVSHALEKHYQWVYRLTTEGVGQSFVFA